MQVRTHQFAQAYVNTVGNTTLYTVPAGHRAVVKWCSATSNAVAPGNIGILGYDGGTQAQSLLNQLTPTRYVLYVERGIYAVVNEGEVILAQVGSITGGGSYFGVGGVLFEL